MNNNTLNARKKLRGGNYTCVFCSGETALTSEERGVKPLLAMIDEGKSLKGFSAADKIVGRAAAFLYILLGADEIFAEVMSKGAKELFDKNGMISSCEVLSDSIRNREDTGICPMDSAVADIDEPKKALEAIRKKLSEMKQ